MVEAVPVLPQAPSRQHGAMESVTQAKRPFEFDVQHSGSEEKVQALDWKSVLVMSRDSAATTALAAISPVICHHVWTLHGLDVRHWQIGLPGLKDSAMPGATMKLATRLVPGLSESTHYGTGETQGLPRSHSLCTFPAP